jgi:hypothetical protein
VADRAFAAAGRHRQVQREVAGFGAAADLVRNGHGIAFRPASETARAAAARRYPEPARKSARVFGGRDDQVAEARRFVAEAIGDAPVRDEAVLLVSEVSTNALVHTASGNGGKFEVTVCLAGRRVRVDVKGRRHAERNAVCPAAGCPGRGRPRAGPGGADGGPVGIRRRWQWQDSFL